jgi:hypothetical protein
MTSRNSLLLLIAIVLLVGQLMGKDSTIASVAEADRSDIQGAIEQGGAAVEHVIASKPAPPSRPAVTPAASEVSLDDFYDSVEPDDTVPEIAREVTDDDDPAKQPDLAQLRPSERHTSPNINIE